MSSTDNIPEFHLTYSRYLQIIYNKGKPLSYERPLYNILLNDTRIPRITVVSGYNIVSNRYELIMCRDGVHVATGYAYMSDLNDFTLHGYKAEPLKKPLLNAKTIYTPPLATNRPTITNTTITNTINIKDEDMVTNNIGEYDATTIDAMIDTLLQKKAELSDIESRWKKDEDFNNGDVIVIDYTYSTFEGEKVYTCAVLKTNGGWFTTLTCNLSGANKYSAIVRFFENVYVKKVTYHAVSEGVNVLQH